MTATNPTSKDLPAEWHFRAPLGRFPLGFQIPLPAKETTPVEYSEELGESYLAFVRHAQRKNDGHYLTPASVARFMADSATYSQTKMQVLDPGSGTGVLSAAVCEAACASGIVRSMHIDACESHPILAELTRLALAFSRQWSAQRDIDLTFTVKHEDFVLAYSTALGLVPSAEDHKQDLGETCPKYDLVISNPPYFKIGKDDPRAVAGTSVLHGQPNIYSMFMAISASVLSKCGSLVFIVPRSFASGPYFKRFREVFFEIVAPSAIHLFDSRKDLFKSQAVLQENLVLTARRKGADENLDERQVLISHSRSADDLAERRLLWVQSKSVLDLASVNKELCIPRSDEDVELVKAVRDWPNTLSSLGLDISTGPVVPFRAKQFLTDRVRDEATVPLLWMHNVRPMRVEWPSTSRGKPQWFMATQESVRLLVRNQTYVILRRFSAKEEKRRLVAAPMIQGCLNAEMLGLENHLNYIRGVTSKLDDELAYGIAVLLNSTFLDRYFRVSNGNTQVSATELRAMPLPAEKEIREIGSSVTIHPNLGTTLRDLDALITRKLDIPPKSLVGLQPESE